MAQPAWASSRLHLGCPAHDSHHHTPAAGGGGRGSLTREHQRGKLAASRVATHYQLIRIYAAVERAADVAAALLHNPLGK